MAKRLPVIFLMLVIILSDVMAVDSFEPLSVEFTVDDAVYAGFTNSKVVTTIKPDGKVPEDFGSFKYSPEDNSFVISNMYYYVQTFTAGNIMITLSGTPLQQEDDTAGVYNIAWASSSEDTSGLSSLSSFTYSEQYEQGLNSHQYPRVYSGEIFIRIPIENVKDTSKSYKSTLTLKVTSI